MFISKEIQFVMKARAIQVVSPLLLIGISRGLSFLFVRLRYKSICHDRRGLKNAAFQIGDTFVHNKRVELMLLPERANCIS